MIVVDTNVISEAIRETPEPRVIGWLNRHFPECVITAVTVFELEAGIAMLPLGKRRNHLSKTISRMVQRFGPRIASFDAQAASSAARLFAASRSRGTPLHQPRHYADLQIAGICDAYSLSLATRNHAHFAGAGLSIINPWQS